MKIKDIKIGMKVKIPETKSVGSITITNLKKYLNDTKYILPYLIVVTISENSVMLTPEYLSLTTLEFLPEDLEPYVEPEIKEDTFKKNLKAKYDTEYWCVLNDGSQLFKDTVIKYIKEIYNRELKSNVIGYYGYYGYCGNKDGGYIYYYYNFCNHENITQFIYSPKILTLYEFVELSKPIIDDSKNNLIKEYLDKKYTPSTKQDFNYYTIDNKVVVNYKFEDVIHQEVITLLDLICFMYKQLTTKN